MLRLLPLLLVLLTGPALAEPLEGARTRFETAHQRVETLESEQARLRASHEALVAEIGRLKATERALLPGIMGGRLDQLLKEAHDLAERLEEQDRRVADAERQAMAERDRLVAALDVALANLNGQLARADGPAAPRREAFEHMKALVGERSRLLADLAPADRQRVELPPVGDGASPDELRALADEATDNAERVRSQLGALEGRLQALQLRRRVLRAAAAFERDASLFAEDERTRRLVRSDQPAVSVATPRAPAATGGARGDVAAGAPTVDRGAEMPGEQAPAPPPPSDGAEAGAGDAGNDFDADGIVDDGPAFVEPAPQVGTVAPGPVSAGAGAGVVVFETALDPALLSDDVEALSPAAIAQQIRAVERRRTDLARTASELEKRRAALEARARALEAP